jgi:glutathione S-transferase
MLKFYYHPLSPIARRVWLMLLEKQIPHQPVVVDLAARQQLEPEFLAISPFHHVPAIVDEDVRVIESIAIMDYLELRYPSPALIPNNPNAIAKMRMVQMIITNELMPSFIPIINAAHQPISAAVQQRLATAWQFLENELPDQKYFGSVGQVSPPDNQINLGDIVAGATVPLFHRLGVSLADYPRLDAWRQLIEARPAWQQTRPSEENFQRWQRWIQLQIKRQTKYLS